jgi:phage terminase large subunit-like protein
MGSGTSSGRRSGWHEDDHQARLLANALGDEFAYQWEVIRLAAIAEEVDAAAKDPILRLPDPLGRAPGEVLEPRRFSYVEVMSRRATLGSQIWTAVEQQRPTPPEGSIIKRAWWRRATALPPRYDEVISSWDTKLKDAESGDYTVGQVWGRTGTSVWGMAQYRGQWSMGTAKVAVALAKLRHPAISRHVIESGGYGPELKAALERPELGYVVPPETLALLGVTSDEVEPLTRLLRRGVTGVVMQPVKEGKVARALLQAGKLEAGNVHLPAGADWADALIDEAAAFPLGAHDDMVDAWSQALARLDGSRVSSVATPGRARRNR